MIILHLHDKRYIALQSDYQHKDAIKALAPYPDVKWHADSRRWLVRTELLDKIIYDLGAHVMATVDFWLGYPIPGKSSPKRQRRRRQAPPRTALTESERQASQRVVKAMAGNHD